ncbi:hypothetical protein PUN28_008529 [Cardiocondyla obscurior]|uniref:Uncharacterized protein n=1 Tax=Cardiocondyla obscurior TaxID=286306 RepID=A0AAW2G1H5_9HYME
MFREEINRKERKKKLSYLRPTGFMCRYKIMKINWRYNIKNVPYTVGISKKPLAVAKFTQSAAWRLDFVKSGESTRSARV